jgi:hypothetical protein
MPDNKNHHFVPRFYLRNFSRSERSIDLFNLKSGRLIKGAPIKGQCSRDYLYGKDSQHEKSLSEVEGEISAMFRRVLYHRRLPRPFTAGHFLLCVHVAMQLLRTQYAGEALNESVDKMMKETFKNDPRLNGENVDDFAFGYENPSLVTVFHGMLGFPLLMDLELALIFAPLGTEFITSDNPVVPYNKLMQWRTFGSNTGMASKGLQVFLPIWPRITLVMYDRDVYRFGRAKADSEAWASKDQVHELNVLQAASASENVYLFGPDADVYRVRDHAAKFRRVGKSNVLAFEEKLEPDGSTSQIIGTSNVDIRTDASLDFLRIHKFASSWLSAFRVLQRQPLTVVRDVDLLRRLEAHRDGVMAGRAAPEDVIPAVFGREIVEDTF